MAKASTSKSTRERGAPAIRAILVADAKTRTDKHDVHRKETAGYVAALAAKRKGGR